MKKSSVLIIAAAAMLASCGTAAQYASSDSGHRFQDGIYSSSPDFRSKDEKIAAKAETDALIEKTQASQIYLFGEKKDTVMIPEDMSATIRYDRKLGSTIVTVEDNPYDWHNYVSPWYYYTPYSIGSSWYWSRHYDPWYSSPYYWNAWAYNPYRYYGWYDPFYIGGWYDPWYYGYSGWYSPWYGYMYPHYAGWYGGWDPYWDYHHHIHIGGSNGHDDRWQGPRRSTGSDRVFTSRVPVRGGGGSRTGRTAIAQSGSGHQMESGSAPRRVSSGRVSATAPARTTVTKTNSTVRDKYTATTARPVSGVTPARPAGNISGTRQVATRPAAGTSGSKTSPTANFRRPAASAPSSLSGSTGPSSYRRTGTTTYGNSGTPTYRSDTPSSVNRSSYNSSSISRSSGSSYSGGASRSGGSYSSGGASRSGGSSGGRR